MSHISVGGAQCLRVDAAVEEIYQSLGAALWEPPGVKPLAERFFYPHFSVVVRPASWATHPHTSLERQGDRWVVCIDSASRSGLKLVRERPILTEAVALAVAHEWILRTRSHWTYAYEHQLADAIVLPTPALILWLSDFPSRWIAKHVHATESLVVRRTRVMRHGILAKLSTMPMPSAVHHHVESPPPASGVFRVAPNRGPSLVKVQRAFEFSSRRQDNDNDEQQEPPDSQRQGRG